MGKMKELVSVVVPVYNVEKYVERCVDSIINQTYSHLEIILVDDGSTDTSGEKCEELSKQDSRIKVIHKKNGGLSDARNYGLDVASGEYILFVDSDDWIDEGMIAYLVTLLKDTDSDISVCGYFEDGLDTTSCDQYAEERIQVYETNREAVYALNHYGASIGTVAWNKLYKANIFTALRFDVGRLNEDVFLMPKIFYAAGRIAVSRKKFYHYIVSRPESIMNKPVSEKNLDVIDAFYSNYLFFLNAEETDFADLYWFKYYGSMIDMYCKFCSASNNIVSAKLKKTIHKEFGTLLKKGIRNWNQKELLRGILFCTSSQMYKKLWRRNV